MSKSVIILDEAQEDFRDVQNWYESKVAGLGLVFARRAFSVFDNIGSSPEIYGLVWRKVRAAPIRRHPQLIYYRVFTDRVEVIAIIDGSRDASVWKSRV